MYTERLLVPDTETTERSPGQICQLAYLLVEGNAVTGKNFFFRVDSMSETSQQIHGFSPEMLETLSGGRTFADHADEILADLRSADRLIGHNISADVRFLRTELERAGHIWQPRSTFCTMNRFTALCNLKRKWNNRSPKPPKLTELCRFLQIDDVEISEACARWFGASASAAHDARFDAAATYLAYLRGVSLL